MTILEIFIFLFLSTIGSFALVSDLLTSDKEVMGKIVDSISHGLDRIFYKNLFMYVIIPFLIFFIFIMGFVFLIYSIL